MLGLFHYTYDYYEWEKLIAISEDRKKLKERWKKEVTVSPLIGESKHYSMEELHRESGLGSHYVIKKVENLDELDT